MRAYNGRTMMVLVFTFVCGVAYPLLSTAVGQLAFNDKADGSLIRRDGVAVGSKLIDMTLEALPVAAGDAP